MPLPSLQTSHPGRSAVLRLLSLSAIWAAFATAALPPIAARADDTSGSIAVVPLSDDGLPANDLVYQGQILDPQQAEQLKTQKNVDLSTLSPDPTSDVWKNVPPPTSSTNLDALPISSGQSTTYLGVISSSEGRFKFNVQTQGADGIPQTYTIMLSETLHTTLMRKELLRRLGYVIPAMKYLPEIKVTFPDLATRDFFLTTQLVDATNAAWDQTRWLVAPPTPSTVASPTPENVIGDSLVVTLRDVVAMDPTPIIYNVAMGPPVTQAAQIADPNNPADPANYEPEQARVLRALAVPYALLDAPESINSFDWYAGRIASGNILLQTPDLANFSLTLDDALWITRKLATLTRADFTQIVANSDYPQSVATVIVEKLIARRNSLVQNVGLKDVAALPFNQTPSDPPELVNGKLIEKDWTQDGYASRFSHETLPTPLQDIKWYGFSELESNIVNNLLVYANNEIPSLTVPIDINNHNEDLFNKAVQGFLQTGQVQTVHFGAWAAPLASANLNISRDVVIGDYMGTGDPSLTSSFVQLADTFGVEATLGVYVGFDGLPAPMNASVQTTGQYSVSLTHLKPLTTLKQAVTEPITEEFVPWVFGNASGIFRNASALKNNPVQNADQLKKDLSAELQNLEKFMGVGESLLLTQSIDLNAQASVGAAAPIALSPGAEITAGGNAVILSRLRFYRKDTNTIQVFKDSGDVAGESLSFQFVIGTPVIQFPVMALTGTIQEGKTSAQVFSVNINPDVDPNSATYNPLFYSNASALSAALNTGSVEVLQSLQKPNAINLDFTDKSTTFNILFYVWRALGTNADISVHLPDGTQANYISLSDGTQSGFGFQMLATQAADFLVQYLSNNPNYGFNTQPSSDPGTSLFGKSQTRVASFQGLETGNTIANPFVQVEYRWEGWSIAPQDMIALTNQLSQQYGFQLYPAGYLNDTQKLQLYELALTIDVYQAGIQKLLSLTQDQVNALVTYYADLDGCVAHISGPPGEMSWPANGALCPAVKSFSDGFNTYRKGGLSQAQLAQTTFQITSSFEKFMPFPLMVQYLGGQNNILVGAMLTAFREGSEEGGGKTPPPIYSNTYGAADPVNPNGVMSTAESILGIDGGEFNSLWIRNYL